MKWQTVLDGEYGIHLTCPGCGRRRLVEIEESRHWPARPDATLRSVLARMRCIGCDATGIDGHLSSGKFR